MPSSRYCTIPYVMSVIAHVDPQSILDVGIGFGKWGYLFREYTDIVKSSDDPGRYLKQGWRTRIDGIEAFPSYIHDAERYIYDRIHEGDARQVLPTLGAYDVIFIGDVIEHFTPDDGQALLKDAWARCTKCMMLTTPKFETGQGELNANVLETHRSLWTPEELRRVAPCDIYEPDHRTYFVVYWKPGVSRFDPEWAADTYGGVGRGMKHLARSVKGAIKKD